MIGDMLGFLSMVFATYWGEYAFQGLFFIALVILYVLEKEPWKRSTYLWFGLIIQISMVTPVIYGISRRLWGVSFAYYNRLYSLIPIFFIIAYAAVLLMGRLEGQAKFVVVIAFSILVIGGGRGFLFIHGSSIAKNVEKLPEEVKEISHFLATQESGKEIQSQQRDITIALPEEWSLYMRQYDASIKMPYGRIKGEQTELISAIRTEHWDSKSCKKLLEQAGKNDCDYVVSKNQNGAKEAFNQINKRPIWESQSLFLCDTKGYSREMNVYSEEGEILEHRYTDSEGNLRNNASGYAVVKYQNDENEHTVREMYYDSCQKPAILEFGGSGILKTYDSNKRLIRSVYLNSEGKAIISNKGYAEIIMQYDQQGWISRETTLDTKGNIIKSNQGYATKTYEYSDDRRVITETYYDEKDEPVCQAEGLYGVRRVYTSDGKLIRKEFYDLEGHHMENEKGAALIEYVYDEDGVMQMDAMYDKKGQRL